MEEQTWVYLDGETERPVTASALHRLVREGRLSIDTAARHVAAATWSNAGALWPELFETPRVPVRDAHAWIDRRPHPWRRYLARITDNIVVGMLIWSLISIVAFSIAPATASAFFSSLDGPGGRVLEPMMTVLLAIPGNAIMIGATGLSLGKWIFGVRVLRDGEPIGVAAALRREIAIWFRGLAFGIPLVSLFTLISSYNYLTTHRTTSWDKAQGFVVVHRAESSKATVGMVLGVVLLGVIVMMLRMAGK